MPWVKLYIEMLDDERLMRLSEGCRMRFVELVLLAGICDADGLLTRSTGPMSLYDIARRLRLRIDRLEKQMASLVSIGFIDNTAIGYRVVGFSDRQGRPHSEQRADWNKRQATARARKLDDKRGPDWRQVDDKSTQLVTSLSPGKHNLSQETPENTEETQNVTRESRVQSRVEESKRREDTTRAQKPARAPSKDYYPLAEALAHVCHMDLESNKGRLFREAKLLSTADPTPTPDLLRQHYNGDQASYWRRADWRGRAGQDPSPSTIRETWGKWGTPPPAENFIDYN